MADDTARNCPICNNDNSCGNIAGKAHGTCWCSQAFFPEAIFARVPEDQRGQACICQTCLEKFKEDNRPPII